MLLVNGLEYFASSPSLFENVLVPDKVTDVTARSSTSWERFTVEAEVYPQFSPEAEKLDKAVFPLPLYRVCDLCSSPGLANREVSALNQLYSKGTECLCFSTQ